MSIEKERLISLIEFAQHSARLRTKPASSITQHSHFSLQEQGLRGLPGVRLNDGGEEGEDEVWLCVDRIFETNPPEVSSPILCPWIQVLHGPVEEPSLLEAIEGIQLITAGTHISSLSLNLTDKDRSVPTVDPQKTLLFQDYCDVSIVRSHFKVYLAQWHLWAEQEKLRLKTIQLYSKLFTLKQGLEGSLIEAQIELLWGVGIGVWRHEGTTVNYPLVTRSVELSLCPETARIEIRPRDVDPRMELDWYASMDIHGVGEVERGAREFFSSATRTFSPFDRITYEPILRIAATHLDANGVYWPDNVPSSDRSVPKADETMRVTDTWVLFARPRTNNIFIQDLEKLKKKAEETVKKDLPPAIAAIIHDPADENTIVDLNSYRGVSAVSVGSGESSRNNKVRELYFPKPYNDEQVRIIQLLEMHDGVVVQGPPGTGKTHSIANVICHYLAQGKRVLVTSMKEPALTVLQEHLPDEIRPLAISLLLNEQNGKKQFEHSIQKIATEVQALDRHRTDREIKNIEVSIDGFHERLTYLDRQISDWARKNMAKVSLDDEEIYPEDAAREVTFGTGEYEWIPDALDSTPEFHPTFSDADVVLLREARRTLAQDIGYLGCSLPQMVEFPDSKALLDVHQDLANLERLKESVEKGDVPEIVDSTDATLALAQESLLSITYLNQFFDKISRTNKPWCACIKDRLRCAGGDDLIGVLENLGSELLTSYEKRKGFYTRLITVPVDVEIDSVLMEAIKNLSLGRKPFGLIDGLGGRFGKSQQQRKLLDSIHVGMSRPAEQDDWVYVHEYLQHLLQLRELALRWNVLAVDLGIEKVPGATPDDGVAAADLYKLYCIVKESVKVEEVMHSASRRLFPAWGGFDVSCIEGLSSFERALQHHLTKNRLANVWVTKQHFQKVLDGRKGLIIDAIRNFLCETLGNPSVSDAQMQVLWSAHMEELSRVHSLVHMLATVRDVCEKFTASGAPQYAEKLQEPLEKTVDELLPDNWRKAWRLKRLATHLEGVDPRYELKKLSSDRTEMEKSLAQAYQDVVVKRTWLKLAENASPSIRSALQAYLGAIQKIGKGTGKRAVRYRQDARDAATLANPAVPCWIMPHYRVSESLPAEFGCFDLVIIDEASQSDLTALPALLRAQKVLVVGDEKQVSPEGVGLDEEKVRALMSRFLASQVTTYRAQMSPDRSIYDLFKVVFAQSSVMLKEHFRCISPIIEYSKREFYNHELQPLRVPKASERLDPPLIDVVVTNGFRKGDLNLPEVRFIVEEIKAIVSDPKMSGRTIGVVSLLGEKQALQVWDTLTRELTTEVMERHHIACGDARTFQGKERNIMFLTMVSAPNDVGIALSRDTFAQRFNVAASRAQDRMYLVRSVSLENLSSVDRLRRSLIAHFSAPFAQDETSVENLRELCESPFEREVYDELAQRGYRIVPQVRAGQYRIDLVVEGGKDERLAIECDGDRYHGPDKWAEDMHRQRVLERAGWVFWRCFASVFVRRRQEVIDDLLRTLTARGIEPLGAEGAGRSIHTERRYSPSDASYLETMDNFEGSDAEDIADAPSLTVVTLAIDSPEIVYSETISDQEVNTLPAEVVTNTIPIIGDIISYQDISNDGQQMSVRIIHGTTNLVAGELNKNAPLAQMFLNLEVGEEGELLVPGHSKRIYKLLHFITP